MARTRQTKNYSAPSESLLHSYRQPDPATVAMIIDDYGYHAACERWNSLTGTSLRKIAARGRKIMAARAAA